MQFSKEQQYTYVGLALFVVVGVAAVVFQKLEKPSQIIPIRHVTQRVEQPAERGGLVAGEIYVQISGAVGRPGVYQFSPGSRMMDLLKIAGGTLPGADLASVNLVEILQDGTHINIPFATSQQVSSSVVSMNSATASELDSLPGIGPGLSKRILEYRQAHGPFGSVDDLGKVPGVGHKLLQKLRDKIRL